MSLIRTPMKGCPHCEADGTLLDGRWNSMGFRVRCQCGAATSGQSRQEALDAWNKRSVGQAITTLIDGINGGNLTFEGVKGAIGRCLK